MVRQRCKTNAYCLEKNGFTSEKYELNSDKFYRNRGCKVDGKNHNWIFHDKALFMPFNYMSFVIKKEIEDGKVDFERDEKVFDQEPFNYIFFRGSSFIDGEFVYSDH